MPAILQTFNKIIALSGQFSAAFTRFTGKILRIFAKRKPGWIGCGIFILFALIWLFGLITSQSRLRFACDFFMVGALFIMLIGFGGRHKQVLLQEKRQTAIALKQKEKSKKKLLKQAGLQTLLKQNQYKNAKIKYASYKEVQKTELAYYNAVVSINGLTLAQYQKQVNRAKEKYDQAAGELGPR